MTDVYQERWRFQTVVVECSEVYYKRFLKRVFQLQIALDVQYTNIAAVYREGIGHGKAEVMRPPEKRALAIFSGRLRVM